MKLFNVDANIVALSGIAIAIGTMVDMGVVMCENILTHLARCEARCENRLEVIHRASLAKSPEQSSRRSQPPLWDSSPSLP